MEDSLSTPLGPTRSESAETRKIEYLSPAVKVSMADRWFEIAALDHFWVRRRFQVLQLVAGNLIKAAVEIAEIGCGHGLVQRQIEDAYGKEVTGFDLNDFALRLNISRKSRVCCYDIFQQEESLRQKFDLIILFDVLEHIEDEDRFLKAVLFHLRPKGRVVINVPAGQWLYSGYDRATGHVRRYSMRSLRETASRNQIEVNACTYWGLPFVPALLVRKFILLMGNRDPGASGFATGGEAVNEMMGALSRCERIPQAITGTSVMAVFSRSGENQES